MRVIPVLDQEGREIGYMVIEEQYYDKIAQIGYELHHGVSIDPTLIMHDSVIEINNFTISNIPSIAYEETTEKTQ